MPHNALLEKDAPALTALSLRTPCDLGFGQQRAMRVQSVALGPVAIIGWGSLIWRPGDLAYDRLLGWRAGGPRLPLEFSRLSSDGRLTLVIDPRSGVMVPTRFATSSLATLDRVIRNLADREGISDDGLIGFVDTSGETGRAGAPGVIADLSTWTRDNGFSYTVWTDLTAKTGFTLEWAMTYLQELRGVKLKRAREYILRAPQEIRTPLKSRLIDCGWLAETGNSVQ
jgi:hypothetical protein